MTLAINLNNSIYVRYPKFSKEITVLHCTKPKYIAFYFSRILTNRRVAVNPF